MDELVLDDDQRTAAAALATVARRLGRRRWAFARGFGSHALPSALSRPVPRGVYLHGRPGRGKTMLMDEFYERMDSNRKCRFHFHQFFARLHIAIAESGALPAALDALLGDTELICFDEFHVHDVGDAMLITRLLEALFARRVVLVATSNYPPEELLPNPLTHAKFEPAIALLRAHLAVVAVDGPQDYRARACRDHARTGFASGRYVRGQRPGADRPAEVPIAHLLLRARTAEADLLVVDFDEICAKPLSAIDFLALAHTYRRWVVCAVPLLRRVPVDAVTRFVNLVDVLYDADLALTLYAEVPLPELVRDVAAAPDLERTASRLGRLPGARPVSVVEPADSTSAVTELW